MMKSRQVPEPAARLAALDFTKGALVVCMVAYHSLNYSTNRFLAFEYMAFLPPSFILIAGFLMSRVYFTRPRERDAATCWRMVIRGLKLLVIFTLLNVVINLAGSRNYNGQPLGLGVFFAHWPDVYLRGNGSWAAFEILLPIAYLLLLGPLFLWCERRSRWVTPVVAAGAVLAAIILESSGRVIGNAGLLSAGVFGLLLGRTPQAWLDWLGRNWWAGLAAYAGYVLVSPVLGQTLAMQVSGAVIALAALYGVGAAWGGSGWLATRISCLGMYSLVAYIAQIGLLQVVVRLAGRPEPASMWFAVMSAGVLVATSAVVEVVHWTRARSRGIDGLYRLGFA